MEDSSNSSFKVVDKRRFNEQGDSLNTPEVQSDFKKEDIGQTVENQSDEIDFASFLVGMYSQTLIYLGEIPSPDTSLISKNVEAAKQNIDILNILEEKTKGNLSQDEEKLMTEILNNLRLIFVKKVK